MKGKYLCAVTIAAIALIATGASAVQTDFTGAVSADWAVSGNWTAGTPDGTKQAYIGTAGNASVSAEISGSATAEYVRVGADGQGSLTINAGATLDISGSIFSGTDDDEWHSLNVAVDADGSLTVGAGATINAPDCIGLGKGPVWYGGGNFTGYIGANATINSDWVTFGLGDDSGAGITQEITIEDAAAFNGTWFAVGGTVNVNGTIWLGEMRWRAYSPDGQPLIILNGDALIESDGFQAQNGGVDIDPRNLNIVTPGDWQTVLTNVVGDWWGPSQREYYLSADAIAEGWEIQLVEGSGGDPHLVQVRLSAVPYQLGDMDGSDGTTEPNGNDINPFVLALVDRPAYELAFPGLDADLRGDCNQLADGLNGNDINPFVDFLLHGGPGYNHIPEPVSMLMLGLGACLSLLRRRR